MSESFWGAFNVVNALASLFVFVIGAGMLVALVPPFWTPTIRIYKEFIRTPRKLP